MKIDTVIEVMVTPMFIQVNSSSLVIKLSTSGLKMLNIELGMGRIIFIKLALKILKLDFQILKLGLFKRYVDDIFVLFSSK